MAGNSGGKKAVSETVQKEMLKPLILGNHQRLFTIFSYLVSFGIIYYSIFKHDFGEKRHCFSWIREFTDRKKREFFTIRPDDKLLLAKKQHISTVQSVVERTNE